MTLAGVAYTALCVHRVVKKLRAAGQRNLRFQLKQARMMRREVRRLDAGAAGATELRGAMMSQLHRDATLAEMQALLAAASAETRLGVTAEGIKADAPPQVMCGMPLIHWGDLMKDE